MAEVAALESLGQRKVGEIAANLAGATGVFRRFRIDFCCHGDATLEDAAEARGIDPAELARALDELDPGAAPETADLPSNTGELIDYILARYHERHRRQLPELIQLSRRVEQVHAGKPGVPAGLADILHKALGELEVHMRKEELMIFPAMCRAGPDGRFDGPTAMLREDHTDQGEMIEQVTLLTDDFTVPDGGCATWRALYAGAAEFKQDLVDHIHIENNILFPRFEEGAIRG